ncbi:unnamed protein product [Paramecium octaurelia]|uniref:Uncharacterized protein n=1 Tax=Paramecium octaurelia TaxID=43137 RepID=A0A8S1VJR7_PAROT|nr:unnamed protein product [Paramecium octaurelia]
MPQSQQTYSLSKTQKSSFLIKNKLKQLQLSMTS